MAQVHRTSRPMAVALTAALAPPGFAQTPAPPVAPTVTIEIGVTCDTDPRRLIPVPAPDQPGLAVPHAPTPTRVPARLGVGFGPKIKLDQISKATTLETRLSHPAMGPTQVTSQSWPVPLEPGGTMASLYIFEHDHELVTGLWTFRLFDGPTLVHEQVFEVVDPDVTPSTPYPCFGKENQA